MSRGWTIFGVGLAGAALVISIAALHATRANPAAFPASPSATEARADPSMLARLDFLEHEMRSMRLLLEGLQASLDAGDRTAVVPYDAANVESRSSESFLEMHRSEIKQVIEELDRQRFEDDVQREASRATESILASMGHVSTPQHFWQLESIVLDYWRESKHRTVGRGNLSQDDARVVERKLDAVDRLWPPALAEQIKGRIRGEFNHLHQ